MYEAIWMSAIVGGGLAFSGWWQNKRIDLNAGKPVEPIEFTKLGIAVGSAVFFSAVSVAGGLYPEAAAMFGGIAYEISRRLLKGYNLPTLPKV